MPRLVYAIPCLQVIHDAETNLVNYINCIEQLLVPYFPFEFGEVIIGTSWVPTGPDDHLHLRLRIESPSGQTAAEKTVDSKPFGAYERFRINVRAPLFEVHEVGDDLFHIESGADGVWTSQATLPVRVTEVDAAEAEADAPE